MSKDQKLVKRSWPQACFFADQLIDDQQFQLCVGEVFDLENLHENAIEHAKTDPILAAALLLKISDRLNLLTDFPGGL